METQDNTFLDSMEGIMLEMRDKKTWGERKLACFPESSECPNIEWLHW